MTPKRAKTYRLSDETIRLIEVLAGKLKINRTQILESTVKDFAKRKGVS